MDKNLNPNIDDQFVKIGWNDMMTDKYENHDFYIGGKKFGKVHYYGPYKIVDSKRRMMKNRKDQIFVHHGDDFYVRKEN